MIVKRNTRRHVKELVNSEAKYVRYVNRHGEARFVVSADVPRPLSNVMFERFLCDMSPAEVEALVLSVPALRMIEALGGSAQADAFAKSLRTVLAL